MTTQVDGTRRSTTHEWTMDETTGQPEGAVGVRWRGRQRLAPRIAAHDRAVRLDARAVTVRARAQHPDWTHADLARHLGTSALTVVNHLVAQQVVDRVAGAVPEAVDLADGVLRAIAKAPPQDWSVLARAAVEQRWTAGWTAGVVAQAARAHRQE